jgi:hypothetical protein
MGIESRRPGMLNIFPLFMRLSTARSTSGRDISFEFLGAHGSYVAESHAKIFSRVLETRMQPPGKILHMPLPAAQGLIESARTLDLCLEGC